MSAQAITETHFFSHGSVDEPVTLRNGQTLPGYTLAYETWGILNAEKSNTILIFHALSGTHHVAGHNPQIPSIGERWTDELHHGWWENFVGSGKMIDTDKYFVICANYLGGCYGSTGPASHDPRTGKPYGSTFPRLAVADLVESNAQLLAQLGIEKLHAVVGASVGGLCALTFATRYPEKTPRVISIASGFKTTVLNRLILFEQILAIENDPFFNGGDYYESGAPRLGLALARMISHKTFVHLDAIERRARQDVHQDDEILSWYQVQDPFQSYMLHQGKKFTQRFDANTYLRIIDMWSRYDAVSEADASSPDELLAPCKAVGQRFLVFSIDSDFCFYPEEQSDLMTHLQKAEIEAIHLTVHSNKGHDSFLLEPELYGPHVKQLLE